MERASRSAFDEYQRELVKTCGPDCYQKCMGLFFAFLGGDQDDHPRHGGINPEGTQPADPE